MSAKSLIDVIISPISLIVGDKVGHLISGIAIAAIGIATGQMWLVGIGLSLAGGSLSGGTPGSLADGGRGRLLATLDTTAPRKFVLGNTAGATDVRYQAYTGANQAYYEQIVALASHKVNSIYELWIDNEKAWTSGGGVQGRYVGYLTVDAITEGTNANGIAIDSTWTTSCTLTGCAYLHLKFKLTGADSTTPSPFQGGVSSRLTIRTKGALVYDPRKDSTVTGGSGTQRATDQTTWAWDDNGSRNPALQLLWYLLGWKINGKLAVGMGVPPARIDLASFITAANTCDESVALKAGGTEPRYRSDGVLSEGDDRKSVTGALCGTMNAALRDAGGQLSLQVIYNDLSTIAATFNATTDIIGNEEWAQTQPLSNFFNIYRGNYIDASDNALYQPSAYPEVSITSPDGLDRIQTFDQALVQSVTQAQRLAKLRLMRGQFQGKYSAEFTSVAWATTIGKNVTLTHAGLGFAGKTFRTAAQKLDRTGKVSLVLAEEDASIYAWATTDEGTPTVAGTPPVADPANNPLVAPTTAEISQLITTSYVLNPDPTTPVLSANDTTIFVKDHQRVYSDKTVSVLGNGGGAQILDETGAAILDETGAFILDETASSAGMGGLTAATVYYVGYSDPTRAGGAETYIASTSIYNVTNSGAGGASPYMHYVGAITTASAGSGTTTSGSVDAPPGYSGTGGAGALP